MYKFVHCVCLRHTSVTYTDLFIECQDVVKAPPPLLRLVVDFKSKQIKFIKQKDHESTYIASNKQQLAINFTVHKNIVIHLHKINFTKVN